jgi:hypothetical protein
MKLGDFKDVDVESTEELNSIDFSMDMDSMGILFKGFSDNLYSNKIGSIVREVASNCFDANSEVGYTGPVKISINEAMGDKSGSITFTDNGPGLSPDRIQNVYAKYFASTKRNSNNEIGGFGIGAKSPFSYTDTFQVITYVDGTEYHYLMHRGVSAPQIKLVYKADTTESNGTSVVIPIKSMDDVRKFRKEIKEQLRYFDNIDYDNCGIDNDYRIIRFGPLIMRSHDAPESLSICIGKVRYPLDKYQLSSKFTESTNTNFSLYFDIGELSVTMNREQIDYNDETIAKIEERYSDARQHVKEYFDAKLSQDIGIMDFIALTESGEAQVTFDIDGETHLGYLKGVVKNVYDNATHPAFKDYPEVEINSKLLNRHFELSGVFESKRMGTFQVSRRASHAKNRLRSLPREMQSLTRVYEVLRTAGAIGAAPIYRTKGASNGGEKCTAMRNQFIHEKHNDTAFILLELVPEEKFFDLVLSGGLFAGTYTAPQKASNDPNWLNFQQGHKLLRKMIISEVLKLTEAYDKIILPEAFVKQYKEDRKTPTKRKLQDEEIIARAPYLDRTHEGEVLFTKMATTLKSMHMYDKKGVILIYGNNNDTENLKIAFKLVAVYQNSVPFSEYVRWYSSGSGMKRGQRLVLKIASNNTKVITEHFRNAIHVDDFLKTSAKFVQRFLVELELSKLALEYSTPECLHPKERQIVSYVKKLKGSYPEYANIRKDDAINLLASDFGVDKMPIYIAASKEMPYVRITDMAEVTQEMLYITNVFGVFDSDSYYKTRNTSPQEVKDYLRCKSLIAAGIMPNANQLKESKFKRKTKWYKESTDLDPENQSVLATEE